MCKEHENDKNLASNALIYQPQTTKKGKDKKTITQMKKSNKQTKKRNQHLSIDQQIINKIQTALHVFTKTISTNSVVMAS